MLKIFGRDSIRKVFQGAQVLSLRNIMGEGLSLTHEEWNILWPELSYFSEDFAKILLENTGTDNLEASDALQLVENIFKRHPNEGDSKLCNKLVGIVPSNSNLDHQDICEQARNLYVQITKEIQDVYAQSTTSSELDSLAKAIIAQTKSLSIDPHATLIQPSNKPSWYRKSRAPVARNIILQLLFQSNSLEKWENVKDEMPSNRSEMPSNRKRQREEADPQAQVVAHIREVFGYEYIFSWILMQIYSFFDFHFTLSIIR